MPTSHEGIDGLRKLPNCKDIVVVFDATSTGAHIRNNEILQRDRKKVIDLTPAAIGPFTIPVINGDANIDEPNVNMVTCAGRRRSRWSTRSGARPSACFGGDRRVDLVEIVRPRHARQHRRIHRDDFERDREARGAERGKAIIILNPAEPPVIMRDTVFTLSQGGTQEAIEKSVEGMAEAVRKYVPGDILTGLGRRRMVVGRRT